MPESNEISYQIVKSQCDSDAHKKVINSKLKTTKLSPYFQSEVKSLKDFYSTNCKFFHENNFLSSNQSDFRPGGSFMSLLLSTHDL